MAQAVPVIIAAIGAGVSISESKKQTKLAKRSQEAQKEDIDLEKQRESAALAEEDDVIARRRLLTIQGGRRSLIRTSETGTSLRKSLG